MLSRFLSHLTAKSVLIVCLSAALLAAGAATFVTRTTMVAPSTKTSNPVKLHIKGQALKFNHATPLTSTRLEQTSTQPLTLATADFDEDGTPDLLSGAVNAGVGFVSYYRGNAAAISPQARLGEAVVPFFSASHFVNLPAPPDFLVTGDFNADGHTDVIAAARGGVALYLLAGDGKGGFAEAVMLELGGEVTALSAGEFNSADSLTDMAVALSTRAGGQVQLFSDAKGAWQAQPLSFDFAQAPIAMEFGQLTADSLADLVVAAGNQMVILEGSQTSPRMTRTQLTSTVVSLTVGRFTDQTRDQVALLAQDGSLSIATPSRTNARRQSNRFHSSSEWQVARIFSNSDERPTTRATRQLMHGRISGGAFDDLLTLQGNQLQCVTIQNTPQSATVALEGTDDLVTALPLRMSASPLQGVVFLRQNESAPLFVQPEAALTFTVNSTSDEHDLRPGDGICTTTATGVPLCTLRAAIEEANANPGADTIHFNIGPGTQTIYLSFLLPFITEALTIDGTPLAPAPATQSIVVNGERIPGGVPGSVALFTVIRGNTVIRGLTISAISKINGISLTGGSQSVIEGNTIRDTYYGIAVLDSARNTIGGTSPAARNVIAGNSYGIFVQGALASNNRILGNYIGTDATGTRTVGNRVGVFLSLAPLNTIGGTTATARNVISGNLYEGIFIDGNPCSSSLSEGADMNTIQGNYIGTDATGRGALGNGWGLVSAAVSIDGASNTTIGGVAPGAGNVIANNYREGIWVLPLRTSTGRIPVNNAIQGNSIYNNGTLGIELDAPGVTANDPGDGDSGANNLQNFPLITSALTRTTGTTITGTLNSKPNSSYVVEIFANRECDPSGNGEGETFVTRVGVATDDTGNGTFAAVLETPIPNGQVLTATATDANGNTSEFSPCRVVRAATVDLSITKTASPATVIATQPLIYTITVSNAVGADPATGVVVTDVLPAGLSFSSATTSQGTCSTPAVGTNGTVTCALGTITPTNTATITLRVILTGVTGGALSNTATVSSNETDSNPTNSTATQTTTVSKADTTVALASSPNPAGLEQSVTFTATVAAMPPGTGTPTGAVVFVEGETTLGTAVVNANGQALFTTTNLASGSHSIIAKYGGDASFNPSTSPILAQEIVAKANTSVTLTSSANPAGQGQSLTFTATVTAAVGIPTGTVTFMDGETTLSSAPVNANGQATLTTASLALGSHPIEVQYGGSANFNPSNSATLVQVIVFKGNTTVALTSSQNPASLGQAVTLTATVAVLTSGAGTPSGSVMFIDGETTLGSALVNANGQASLTTANLALGEHPIVAQYSGNTNMNPSVSSVLVQVINTKAIATVVLTSSVNPASLGQAVTFTATVTGVAGLPIGVVTLVDGTTTLGSSVLNANGEATFTTSSLTLGEHAIVAQYSGDVLFNPSTSAVLTQVINSKANTSVALSSSQNPASLGQDVTFTATVTGGAGLPSGTVTFVEGTTTLGIVALNNRGQATITTSSLTLGEHPIVAQYSGAANFNGSTSGVLTQIINTKARATVTLTTSANPASLGQAVTFMATVTATAGGIPTGSAVFVDGTTTLGSSVLNANGEATFTTSSLTLGEHAIVAQYSGDTNVNPSVSAVLVQAINTKTSTSVVLLSSENPVGAGQDVTFTAIVTASSPGAGLPSGSVTFVDRDTILGTVLLSANGQASLTTSSLGLGTHLLVAQYSGDVNFNPGTSPPLTQIINNKAKTAVALISSANPAGLGQAVTFTATVTGVASGTGTPSGTVTFREGETILGSASVNTNGQAMLTLTTLALGEHPIVAQYGGDGFFNLSTSAVLVQTINTKNSASVTLTSSVNPASLGQAVTFTATVTGGAGLPSGTVTFVEGTTTLGSAALNANGQATFTTSDLTLGEHPIVAQYSGDTNFNPRRSDTVLQVINSKASTTIEVRSSANPASLGQAVTFTATVVGVGETLSGTVTFREGTTTLSSAGLNANGQVTFTTSSLALGEHPIVAQYSGDANFNPSNSAVLVQVINTKTSTSVMLASSVNPASQGQAVTFTATVTATAGGTPTGVVSFVEGTILLGSAALNANGEATLTTSSLALGNHSIVAQYSGDTNFNPSTSAVLVQVISSKASATVTLASSANPASLGQVITLTATVNGLVGSPTGQMTFVEGTTTLGSTVVNANGQATLTLTTLALGEHLIVAQYSGDVFFNPSLSAPLTQVINTKASASVALTSSSNPASLGQAVTFTATVVASSGTPSGTVRFVDGSTTLGSSVLNANGQATLTTSSLTLGEHPIVAQYSGDANVNPSVSAVLVQVINTKASTSVTLTSSANPASVGQAVTLTAVVTSAAGSPTGQVTFREGGTTLGSATVNASGQATFTTSSLTLGEHLIVAQYGGDTNFNPSTSAVLVQTINTKNSASVTLTSSVNPASLGQAVTFTATVTGGAVLPSGTVTFREGESTLGSATVNANGQASFTITSLALGEHPIVAQYGGEANFNPSNSAVLVQVINSKVSTSITITSSVNPASLGQGVTFTATVVVGSGTPSGTVTFVEGTTTLGSSAVNANGQATFTTSSLVLGEHPIVAQYSGDVNFNGSTSAVLTQVINTKNSASVTLTSSVNPASLGQAVTFRASVTAIAGGTPTGSVTFVDGTTTLGSVALNGSGVASITVSNLALGTHSIVAQYVGDSTFNPSTSNPLLQVINNQGATTVSLNSSANPAGVGQAVTFTASVAALTSGSGTPTGSVNFVEGSTVLGSAQVNAIGQATFTTTTLALGSHVIVAQYGGDTNFNGSVSAPLTQIINTKAGATITLTSSQNPAGLGQAITLTATVAGGTAGAATPTGLVTFVDGETTIGSTVLNATGQASLTTTSLGLGDHALVARYNGDDIFNGSTSAILVQVINTKGSTTVVLSSSANPASLGQAVTLTATVEAGGGTPSGVVTFVEGTTTLGSASVNANGQATLTTSSLAVGTHPIVAQYGGDANFNPSTSAVLTQVINSKAGASVAITSSANPASLGQAVTFTATVIGLVGLPTGVVTFVDGTTTLGSSAVNANGQATFTTSSLTLGEHPMVAQYSGDANFNGSTSTVLTQVINTKASTNVTLTSSQNPASLGQAITLTATVVASSGTPSGSVTFVDGGTTLGTVSLSANGQASLTTANLALGAHPIVAQYSGDTNVNPSVSVALVQVINTKAIATVALTSSTNPASLGQSVTFTATVTGEAGLALGVVTFVDGTTTLGNSVLNANGQATFTTSSLVLGDHPIVALYSGDALFNPRTSAVLTQVVNSKASTSVTLTSSVNPAGVGQAVTFTATVTPSAPGTSTPSGSVTFVDGGTTLGTVSLSANGQASLTTSSLGLGTHLLVAQYSGDANFNPGTSPPLTQGIVVKSETSVTLTSSANPAGLGQAVTFTATVRGGNGTPSGSVTFVDGTTTLGNVPITTSGEARFTTTSLALGNHGIVAQYSGDVLFNPSTSALLTQVINTKAGTAVTLSSSANPASVGQAVTFTATVAVAVGTGTPSGSVTFVDGTTTLGSASVNTNGQATLTLATLPLGEHPIVAQYGGDANFNGSTSAVLIQVINTKASASVAITSSANPASLGQTVTFTATVNGLVGLPTGVVTFVDGGTTLGSATINANGQASLTTANLALGNHPIVAQYGGDTLFNPSMSAVLVQTINTKTSTSVTLTSSVNPASQGQAVTFTATVTVATGLPTGVVTFVEGATTLGSTAVNASGQATFTTSSLALGEHPIAAQYSGDANFNPSTSTVLTQVINTKASTSVTLTSSANPASQGQAVTFTASVMATAGGGTPSGSVTFVDGTTTLGSSVLNANGQAIFTTSSSLAVGSHPIVAQYAGDTNFNPSTSAVLVQVINTKASASVTVTSSVNPASLGQAVTFTVSVVAGGGTPSGTVTLVDGVTTLGTVALTANGQASLTTANLALGAHPIVAQYSGDTNVNPSVSTTLTQVVNTKASATVTLASSANPASLGQAITLTATVMASSGTPSGTVTFAEGTTTLGSALVNANGQAIFTTSSLTLGEHPIVAQYSGDANVNPSVSAVLTQVINSKASTSVVLTSSENPTGVGQPVTFTTVVTVAAGLPTGQVTFREGGTTLGSATVNASGQATFTTSSLTLGEHLIVAQYGGDTNFNPSTSAVLVQTINTKNSTTVVLSSSANPASLGQEVTLTATVGAGGGTPSGVVTFVEGTTTLGSASVNANGQATLTSSSLAVGSHPIVAQYAGDTNFNPSVSSVLVQVINTKSSASVLLTSSANPASQGQAVTFTATVTVATGLPTGVVTFVEGATTLGSTAVNASGQGTFTTSSLALGEHPIAAQYSGDANFNPSTSTVLTQVINTKAIATVVLTSSVNPASLSQAVTFTASVMATAGGGTPSGTVTFVDGTTTLGSSVLNANGQAIFTTSSLVLGEHPIVALYGGDANVNPRRSDTVLQVVNSKASTTIALRSLANPAGAGQAVTFTVTVTGAGGTPGGTITFREGATTLGSSALNANGQATFTPSGLALGDHIIVAQYGGDANFNPSNSAVLVQVVNTKPGTVVSLSSSANPASVGQAVTFTATVAVVTGSGTPSGSVTFVDGTTTLGNAVVNASGQATFTTSSLALGNHLIVAQYSGDANVNPSESVVLVQVINTKASMSVTLISSVNPASQGQAVTFTATVTATAGGTPTGVVTFVDGTTTLGSAAINANGQATLTTSSLTLGDHSVVAQYGGDANFNGNTSAVLVQVINTKASATVTLASSANPASLGQSITLTATVGASSGTPSGSVTFVDGATTLGTVTLSASGQATLTTASLALGNHSIVAQYSGDTDVNSGASTALVQVVNTKASTDVVLTSSVNPAGVGQAVTLTARVNTVTGAPTGQVTFVEGTTTLGSAVVNANGQATLTTASLALGNHTIVAQYGGDENFNPSASPTLTQIINNKAGSTVALSSSPNPANVGQAVTFTATVTALTPGTPPPTGSVTLMDGATTLGSVSLNANGVASFTVSNLTPGPHSIVAQYAGDATYNGFTSTPLTLVINLVFSDLGLTMTASANPVLANSNVTYTLRVSNSGPDAAPSVAVSNILPSALRITNCTATGGGVCSGQGSARVVNFPSLAAGTTAEITITASLGCNNTDVTLVNTATITSLAVDRNPNNDTVTLTNVGQAGKATGTITYESGATALSLGPVVVGSTVAVPAGTGTFTLTNTGCLPMDLTDAFFTRAVTAVNFAGLDDSRYFTLRLVQSSGGEIALNPSPNPDRNAPQAIPIRRTVPSGGQLVFRVTFQPPVPFFAGAFEGLFANQVLPQQFDSRVIFNFVTGSTSPVVAEATGDQGNVTANLKASVDPKIQIVQRENEPLVSLSKTPTDFRVRVSLYDANKNGTLITYQFLNSAGQPATAPIELNLATLLNSSPLLPGQCFTLQQDFSGAANRPDITGVRVTVVDADGANVSATGNLIPSLTALLRFLDAVISPDVLILEPLRLGDISVAAPQQSIFRPTITNVRREK